MVNFLIVDIHEEWEDVLCDLKELYKPDKVNYSYSRILQDISSDETISTQNFDVILLSYVISEIDLGKIEVVAKRLREISSEKTLFIINDRNQYAVTQKIQSLISQLGVRSNEITTATENSHCGESYPDNIFSSAGPTVYMNSKWYNFLVENDN